VTDFCVRVLDEAEHRPAYNLFRRSVHSPAVSDQRWACQAQFYELGRVWGAFTAGRLIGTAMSFRSGLALPGPADLPMAAVSGVGVRADHRRRGVLTELMRAQLTAARTAGEVFAGLRASEAGIYGRFGYGPGTIARTTRVQSTRVALRPEVPRGGEVRLLDAEEALALLPDVYQQMFGHRPGMIRRSTGWWAAAYEWRLRKDDELMVAVHTGPDGHDGFLAYLTDDPESDDPLRGATLRVLDYQAGNQAAANDLWRYLLGVDLVDQVVAYIRPLDEPLEAMLVNQHAVRAELDDELWLRLVDVPAALTARSYQDAEPIVIEVSDHQLPANSGRYRLGPPGAERTDDPPGLAMTVDVLATMYLGATKASALAGVGRVRVIDPATLPRADRLFATDAAAWCGTLF
jgi:predicted acetyltransferase